MKQVTYDKGHTTNREVPLTEELCLVGDGSARKVTFGFVRIHDLGGRTRVFNANFKIDIHENLLG